jgi:hypothetical protein
MPSCGVAGGHQLSEKHNAYLLYVYITEMEVIFSPETLVPDYQTTKCHNLTYETTSVRTEIRIRNLLTRNHKCQ